MAVFASCVRRRGVAKLIEVAVSFRHVGVIERHAFNAVIASRRDFRKRVER